MSTAGTRPCVVCKSDMRADSAKCTQCQSYQDWRRHTTELGFLTGLFFGAIATFVALFALYRDEIQRPQSTIDVHRADLAKLNPRGIDFKMVQKGPTDDWWTIEIQLPCQANNSGDAPGRVLLNDIVPLMYVDGRPSKLLGVCTPQQVCYLPLDLVKVGEEPLDATSPTGTAMATTELPEYVVPPNGLQTWTTNVTLELNSSLDVKSLVHGELRLLFKVIDYYGNAELRTVTLPNSELRPIISQLIQQIRDN